MSEDWLLKKFEETFEAVPVPGTPNYILRPRPRDDSEPVDPAAEPVDWDKFEADINESFERVE
jgi:hypothetical protein